MTKLWTPSIDELLKRAAEVREEISQDFDANDFRAYVSIYAPRVDLHIGLNDTLDEELTDRLRELTHVFEAVGLIAVADVATVDWDKLGDMAPRWYKRLGEHPDARNIIVMLVAHRDAKTDTAACWSADIDEQGKLGPWHENPDKTLLHLGGILCRCARAEETAPKQDA